MRSANPGGALVADERGGLAEEDQIEIVVVIVVDPHGAVEAALRQVRRHGGRESAFRVAVAAADRPR